MCLLHFLMARKRANICEEYAPQIVQNPIHHMAFKKRFQVSDESINCYGFWIRTSGVRVEQAKKNCPAYYNHKTWEVPLGHWEDIRLEGDKIYATIVIEGGNEEEKEYIRKIENGDIKGASGGFDPLKWSTEPLHLKDEQTAPTLWESELFEISLAPLPGNKNALALRTKDGLITLSDSNKGNLIPDLNTNSNMKQIALKLGLSENATEQEIFAAIVNLQSKAATAENADEMRKHIEETASTELDTEDKKKLFAELCKTNLKQALTFLNMNKKPVETPATEGTVTNKKEVKVTDLIQSGKTKLSSNEDDKNSFDYLQKNNSVELARIRKEEPDTYAQLASDYSKGVRYMGK